MRVGLTLSALVLALLGISWPTTASQEPIRRLLYLVSPAAAGHDPGPAGTTSLAHFDPAAFKNPPKDSRPAIYWYWNNTITSDITDRQMAEMRAKVLFWRGG